jgi:hypothetical protein
LHLFDEKDVRMRKYTAIRFCRECCPGPVRPAASSDSAKDAAQADNVEMPAEEAVQDVDAAATPVADAACQRSGRASAASAAPSAVASEAPQP